MKQITLRLPDDLYEEVKREADQLGISIKDLILLMINSYCFSQDVPGLPPVFLSRVA
ncbi:hypothetical protein DKZ27_11150 [Limosilactobacillus reuteri]|uniref:ribbon-helix-helix domain-containing protein n=1 Tax=Limosilactobacillus reuteri TaxID=1598 RepID=UPI000D6FB0C4|nr:hypothetical protein DKZ27_11150 [Limosilactobacillus reuteri]